MTVVEGRNGHQVSHGKGVGGWDPWVRPEVGKRSFRRLPTFPDTDRVRVTWVLCGSYRVYTGWFFLIQ